MLDTIIFNLRFCPLPSRVKVAKLSAVSSSAPLSLTRLIEHILYLILDHGTERPFPTSLPPPTHLPSVFISSADLRAVISPDQRREHACYRRRRRRHH